MSDDNCLDASNPSGPVKLVRCHGMGGNQMWSHDEQVGGVWVATRCGATMSMLVECAAEAITVGPSYPRLSLVRLTRDFFVSRRFN